MQVWWISWEHKLRSISQKVGKGSSRKCSIIEPSASDYRTSRRRRHEESQGRKGKDGKRRERALSKQRRNATAKIDRLVLLNSVEAAGSPTLHYCLGSWLNHGEQSDCFGLSLCSLLLQWFRVRLGLSCVIGPVWPVGAGCYSQAALPMPLSKPLYKNDEPRSSLFSFDKLNIERYSGGMVGRCRHKTSWLGPWPEL